jgi:hypothetical protein
MRKLETPQYYFANAVRLAELSVLRWQARTDGLLP